MLNNEKYDFSKETDLKEKLRVKLRLKILFENHKNSPNKELSDSELSLAAGGTGQDAGKASLPPGWTVSYSPEGFPIYVNAVTGERYDFRNDKF